MRKDINNLAKVQSSENKIADVQHQVRKNDRNQRSCDAIIRLLPETNADDGELPRAMGGLRGWTDHAQGKV